MAQDQLWKPQPTRRSGGRAFAYRGPHLPHAEPQFTHLSQSRHPLTPKSAISPFAADNSPDYLNYYLSGDGPSEPVRVRASFDNVSAIGNAVNQRFAESSVRDHLRPFR